MISYKEPDVTEASNRLLGERCVEIARQVRDGEFRHGRNLGQFICERDVCCMSCGAMTRAVEYENAIDGGYCAPCHAQISQEIYEHEVGLLNSGFYG